MSHFNVFTIASAGLLLANSVTGQIYLSPSQDINLPSSNSATNPLTKLGANSPYFAGPNVNGVENVIPEGCIVEQVAYVSRHGSRYPDGGAYNEWVALYDKIQASGQFKATGDLAFLHTWKPVLTNPTAQIANESPTGWKEAYDLGYRLRTKYGSLYTEGTPFNAWANFYPRVIQTAQNFVRGFLGNNAATLGSVVTVNAKGNPKALFDSLGPSDLCPNFADENGRTEGTAWDAKYLPPIVDRLNGLISGNLTLTTSDVNIFPYLCGYESQITGMLSPFCSTFTDSELEDYQYRQDLRYWYGVGPGTDLPSKMMLPFLNSLVGLLAKGPGTQGISKNGSAFTVPSIIAAFLNDGQVTELVAGTGAFDNEEPLTSSKLMADRKYISSHFVSQRGTVAFERLKCAPVAGPSPTTLSTTTPTSTSCSAATSTLAQDCSHNNCLRQFLQSTALVSSFCATYTQSAQSSTATAALPTFVSQCSANASKLSSACSCVVPATTAGCSATTTSSGATATPTSTAGDNTYIRILFNDAVYPIPSCQSGPGKSCRLDSYAKIVKTKLDNAGNLIERCNVTAAGSPTSYKGASFFTDLTGDWIASVAP